MIIIECEGEIVTDKDFMIWFSMENKELDDLKRDYIERGYFVKNKYRFDLKDLGLITPKEKEVINSETIPRKTRSDKAVFIKDVVMYKETAFFRRDYFMDGVKTPKEHIADCIGVSASTISNILHNVKKININGYIIETKKRERFTDVKYFKGVSYSYKNYFLNGKKTTITDISIETGVNIHYLNKLLTNVKSARVDGHLIEAERKVFMYNAIKDGKTYKNLTLSKCEKLTNLNAVTIKGLKKSGLYSRQDGWRIIK